METKTFYNEVLTDHNMHPYHKHDIDNADLELEGVNPSCGDDIILKLKFDDAKKTIVDVYGAESFLKLFTQPFLIKPASCIEFISYSSAKVTTSASRPFATSRACLPEPPCD